MSAVVWLNLACNVGSSIFAGLILWPICKLIKLWWGQWAVRLAQLLLVKPHLLLKPAPALQNLCSCSHSSQDREVLSGGWWYNPSQHLSLTIAASLLILYHARNHFPVGILRVELSHATTSNYHMLTQETSHVNLPVLPAALGKDLPIFLSKWIHMRQKFGGNV